MNTPSPRFDITPAETIPVSKLEDAERLLTTTLEEIGCVIVKRETLNDLIGENRRLWARLSALEDRYAAE